MKRRNALKNIGLSLGAITMSSTVVGLLQSCQKEAILTWKPIFFSPAEAEMVIQTLEVFLPTTPDIPGATDLNLGQFIDGYLNVIVSEEERTAFKAGIEQYLVTTLKVTGKKEVGDLSLEDIEERLAYYLKAAPDQQEKWSEEVSAAEEENGKMPSEDAVNYSVLESLRSRGIAAFKMTEYIGENVLAYAPIPGEQRGCVDLQEATQGKAWSL
ncbi:MAG: gluconate 2-dehydrogenase subunit 3 family protein [Saprospiraceae bacterium]